MKTFALLLSLVSLPLLAQAPTDVAQQIHDATVLVDQGKHDEAIAILRRIVAADPKNSTATYELGLAWAAKGDAKQCIATIQPVADAEGPRQIEALGMLGNCLDEIGQSAKAIDAYRRGLKLAPTDAQLSFNLAVSLARGGNVDEARALLKKETEANPWHASSFLLLARIFEARKFMVPATMAYLRFLALEPSTPRAQEIVPHVFELLNAAVTKKSPKETNITIDPHAPKDEGDYSALNMAIAMASAARDVDETKASMTPFEKTRDQVASVVQMFTEIADAKQNDYTARVQRPFFASMVDEKQVDAFAALVTIPLHLDGARPWYEAHKDDVQRYAAWIAPQTKRAPVPLSKPPR